MACFQSPVAHIITNAVEGGCSENQTAVAASKYLLENEQKIIARNQLQSLVARMKTFTSATENVKRGSSDPNSPWSDARHC